MLKIIKENLNVTESTSKLILGLVEKYGMLPPRIKESYDIRLIGKNYWEDENEEK